MVGIPGNINWMATAEETLAAHRLPTRVAGKLRRFAVPIEAEVGRKIPERQGRQAPETAKGITRIALQCFPNLSDQYA